MQAPDTQPTFSTKSRRENLSAQKPDAGKSCEFCLLAAQLSQTTQLNYVLWLQPTSPCRAATASPHIPGNAASWRQQIHQRGGDINNLSCNHVYCLTKCISSPLRSQQRRRFSMQRRGARRCHRSVHRGLSHRLERLFGQCRCQKHCLSGIMIQLSCYATPSGSLRSLI